MVLMSHRRHQGFENTLGNKYLVSVIYCCVTKTTPKLGTLKQQLLGQISEGQLGLSSASRVSTVFP